MDVTDKTEHTADAPAQFPRGCGCALLAGVVLVATVVLIAAPVVLDGFGEAVEQMDQAPPPQHWDEGVDTPDGGESNAADSRQ